jgi:hypothetical protein
MAKHSSKIKFKDFTNGLSDFGKALTSPFTHVLGSVKSTTSSVAGSLTLPLLIGGGILVVFLLKK